MNNSQIFYLACYHGNYELAKDVYESDPSVMDCDEVANVCFSYSCLHNRIELPKWITTVKDKSVLFNPYLLIDVCNIGNNIGIVQWLCTTFPIDFALDNHYAFRCLFENMKCRNREIADWLISMRPYKYYIDTSGNGIVRSEPDERWERRRMAMMIFYKRNGGISRDIWRRIVLFL